MCQLLGMNGNTPTDIVFSFTGFSTRAEEHKDGFGIAFFEDAGARLFVDAQDVRTSSVPSMVRSYPIRSKNIIAHIRKATQGVVNLANTHPFQRELWGRYWVFAHNGDPGNSNSQWQWTFDTLVASAFPASVFATVVAASVSTVTSESDVRSFGIASFGI